MPDLSQLDSPAAVQAALDEFVRLGRTAFLARYGFAKARKILVREPRTGAFPVCATRKRSSAPRSGSTVDAGSSPAYLGFMFVPVHSPAPTGVSRPCAVPSKCLRRAGETCPNQSVVLTGLCHTPAFS